MATSNPLAAIPAGISYPLHLAPGLGDASSEGSKKRKREPSKVLGLRYNFKPASITPDTPGAIYTDNGAKSLKFDLTTGGQQVFDAREEVGKSRECVMIWDEDTQTFTLHPLSSTLHLTLNRSASSTSTSGPSTQFTPTRIPPRKDSVTSSSSSTSVPLGALQSESARKRPRPSMVDTTPLPPTAANRSVRGGKALPRKQLPPAASAPAPAAKGRGKAGAKKKLPPTPKRSRTESAKSAKTPEKKGKVKSSEIIEDSDEEAAAYDLGSGKVEEEDEFAMLLGASLADGADDDADGDDDDDEEEEEDDDELGGAKVVLDDDGSEWL